MSEAKSANLVADKVHPRSHELASALLELFELLVANAVDKGDNVESLGEWADEWKPRLERLIRNGANNRPSPPLVSKG